VIEKKRIPALDGYLNNDWSGTVAWQPTKQQTSQHERSLTVGGEFIRGVAILFFVIDNQRRSNQIHRYR